MKIFTKESLISALKEIRNQGWIENRRGGNHGAVGNTLEDLLGIDENNLPIPNATEWELKAQCADTNSLVTLFHMEPSPTAFKFVTQILLPNYGWPHQNAGTRYPQDEMSFRQTINASNYSDRGFIVKIDKAQRKVLVSFDAAKIDERHTAWRATVERRIGLGQLKEQPYWGFDAIFHKVGSKLHNCFYVRAQRKKENGKEYFFYKEILILKTITLENLVALIENGAVYVDFDARTGHNHGTKFRIAQSSLQCLYAESLLV